MRAAVARVTWLAGWPVRMLLLGGIWLYRSTLGPMLAARCRFHPSCSAYAAGAIQVHGALKGSALATWRLLRCSPLTAGGPDPVPPRGRWRAEAPSGDSGTASYGATASYSTTMSYPGGRR